MIKVMKVEVVEGKMETEEVNLRRFTTNSIIQYVEETCEHTASPSDIEIDERYDDYITVKVSGVDLGGDGLEDDEAELLFIGKREDYSGELMN